MLLVWLRMLILIYVNHRWLCEYLLVATGQFRDGKFFTEFLRGKFLLIYDLNNSLDLFQE